MKTKQTKGDKGRADREFSLAVRTIGHCESCNKTQNLQCAHIISRRYAQTRTSFRNALCLCAGCHIKYTLNPLEFAEYVLRTSLGQHVETERQKAYSTTAPKMFWEYRYEQSKLVTSGQLTIHEARERDL